MTDLYHATPLRHLPSVLERGLLAVPPSRNFNCAPGVFLTTTPENAKRWAQEVSRETGEKEFAILKVSVPGPFSVTTNTEISTPQVIWRTSIPASCITVQTIENNVLPAANVNREFERGVPGWVYCPECECNVKDDERNKSLHLEEFHD